MRPSQILLATATALALVAPADAAKYRLDIDVTWSAETHPNDFFSNAHLTRLIGATHNGRFVLFGDGRSASSGVQSVAERGHTEILRAEMEDARERERLDKVFEAEGFGVPARISLTFEAREDYGFASFVTMIAPSPDWFTGAASVELFEDGAWIDRAEITLWPWDAGTDSGTTWTAENLETQPRESIRLLTAPYFFGGDGLKPLGTATFVRIE